MGRFEDVGVDGDGAVVVELGFRDHDTVQLGAYDADGALPLGLDTHQHTGDFFSFHVVPLGGPVRHAAERTAGQGLEEPSGSLWTILKNEGA